MKRISQIIVFSLLVLHASGVVAEPWAAPGDTRLRNDLQLLDDVGAIDIPVTGWPIAWGDISNALDAIDTETLSSSSVRSAYKRLHERARNELNSGWVGYRVSAAVASNPRVIRSFENSPREQGEIAAGLSWIGDRFTVNLNAIYVGDPIDGDELRPDGTYVGIALGNWMLSAGWQERWWGPGRESSLILSTNARPAPGIAIQRNVSSAFQTRWLSWMGPWAFTSFMDVLDDERIVKDTWLFGMRGSFRPLRGLEIGISRSAQWCGKGRNCSVETFVDLLLGKDNRGVNVEFDQEPGNQLGGIDVRWTLPKQIPVAIYAQWIGEDTRQGGPEIGSWLRLAGVESWGVIRGASHRTYFEIADSSCRTGGLGFSEISMNCAYNHSIYRTGYRYQGRSIGHAMDGDGLSYSLGSTLVQFAGHSWNLAFRYMKINRDGSPDSGHSLSATPQDFMDIQISHVRQMPFGVIHVGIGFSELDDELSGAKSSDITGFLRWSTQ